MSNEASLDMQSGSLVSVIETSTGEAFRDCGVINKLKKYEYYTIIYQGRSLYTYTSLLVGNDVHTCCTFQVTMLSNILLWY